MHETTVAPAPEANRDVRLDAEKLDDAYRIAVESQTLSSSLLSGCNRRVLRDQLERGSVSAVLNIAKGAGRRSRADKRRFYSTARGSATECAAALDLLVARRLAPTAECRKARGLVVRIVQMLTKLDRSLA